MGVIPDGLPYVFAIDDHEVIGVSRSGHCHALVAKRLTDAGYGVGLMLWTASPEALEDCKIQEEWHKAMKRAGITKIETGRDELKMRQWYRVWPRWLPPAPHRAALRLRHPGERDTSSDLSA